MLDFSQDTLRDFRGFVQHHREGLQNASLLLGGQAWLQRMQALIDDVTGSTVLTRRMSVELQAPGDLLSLENVHDVDRIEAAYFADLDPASPYVEDICLLAEAMKDQTLRCGAIDAVLRPVLMIAS
ncbi:hypothetical protein [uncultured Tateyamaria sp.]|uniref:hypothetical protein n=1 Tax=uncultured Tateyamaria sp. TaxID=455651 RepID=UPI002638CCFD|nr:hypothetical protein [uncultured Tateyamaria sp.]